MAIIKNTQITLDVNELTRMLKDAYKNGGVTRMYNMDRYINKTLEQLIGKADVTPETKTTMNAADVIDKIAGDPDRFVRGLHIIDSYARPDDRNAFTIIKVTKKDSYNDNVLGIACQNGRWYVMKGVQYKNTGYISDKQFMEITLPSWVGGQYTHDEFWADQGINPSELLNSLLGMKLF